MIRPKRTLRTSYNPVIPVKRKAPEVPMPKFVKHVPAESPCSLCGWPLDAVAGSTVYLGKVDGERTFKHYICPTLSQRRELRRAAAVSA